MGGNNSKYIDNNKKSNIITFSNIEKIENNEGNLLFDHGRKYIIKLFFSYLVNTMENLQKLYNSNENIIINKKDFEKFRTELNTILSKRSSITEEDEITALQYLFIYVEKLYHILKLIHVLKIFYICILLKKPHTHF